GSPFGVHGAGAARPAHHPHPPRPPPPAGEDADGRTLWSADGAARTDQLHRIGLRVPDGPYETLAGLIAAEIGRIPTVDDSVELEGWRIDVVDASGRRAARAMLHAPLPGTEDRTEDQR
ncbi:transporter associated domain-containing protein, partial [Streptomyces anulatus]|uniref:transporter associated domain-containing protein n=1 Tax=Streptomyces anulatus TaxID=1892 RepID=UPI0036DF7B64